VSDEVRLERLTPAEIDARLAESSVVYLPLGSVEFHGPHLPTGLDTLNALGVCMGAAKRGGGVVLPPLYLGIGGGHSQYPWTIMMPASGETVRPNILRSLTRLEQFGVGVAVLFTGHFADEQLAMIDEIATTWNSQDHGMRVLATGVNRCVSADLAPDHAGVFETTLLHSLHPELVHLEMLPDRAGHPSADPDGDVMGPQRHDPAHPLWGVFGPDPRGIDLSTSSALLDHLVAWLSDSARSVATPA